MADVCYAIYLGYNGFRTHFVPKPNAGPNLLFSPVDVSPLFNVQEMDKWLNNQMKFFNFIPTIGK